MMMVAWHYLVYLLKVCVLLLLLPVNSRPFNVATDFSDVAGVCAF
jgi:hypothetical protein